MDMSTTIGLVRAFYLLAQPQIGDVQANAYIDLGLNLLERGLVAKEKVDALAQSISEIASEGRPPTEDEWSRLQRRSDEAHTQVQEHAAKYGIDEPTPGT